MKSVDVIAGLTQTKLIKQSTKEINRNQRKSKWNTVYIRIKQNVNGNSKGLVLQTCWFKGVFKTYVLKKPSSFNNC